MAKRAHAPEHTTRRVREAEVELAKGATVAAVAKRIGVTGNTYCPWTREYGGGLGEALSPAVCRVAGVTTPHSAGPNAFATHVREHPSRRARSARPLAWPESSMGPRVRISSDPGSHFAYYPNPRGAHHGAACPAGPRAHPGRRTGSPIGTTPPPLSPSSGRSRPPACRTRPAAGRTPSGAPCTVSASQFLTRLDAS
jgi:transposase-like protein